MTIVALLGIFFGLGVWIGRVSKGDRKSLSPKMAEYLIELENKMEDEKLAEIKERLGR